MNNHNYDNNKKEILKSLTIKREELLKESTLKNEHDSIINKKSKLFASSLNKDHIIDAETTELFRAMCILSQCSSSISSISSHRPILGKFIVPIKKLAWKIVEPQIKHILEGINACFSYQIQSHAVLINKVNEFELELMKKK